MFYWMDLATGAQSEQGYATRGLAMQVIQQLQSSDHHAYRCVFELPVASLTE